MIFKRMREERGAIIIHVAIALIAMLAFLSIVIDYGMMWVSRRQAQSAADAGALAGAISLLRDGGSTATAKLSAAQFATVNPIWGQANSYDGTAAGNVSVDVSGTGAGEISLPPCGTNKGCVRVDIFRNEPDRPERNANLVRGNPLPTFFARLIGLTQQGVRATATAQTANGNSIRCLLPFAVIDRWADNTDRQQVTTYYPNDNLTGTAGWSQNDFYEPPVGVDDPGIDEYIAPYDGNTGHTGWRLDTDYGRQLILKDGSVGQYSAGWANEIDLPNSTGSNDYRWNIQNCNPQTVGIATAGETCTDVDWEHGCVSIKTGVSQGPTSQGIGDAARGLIGEDSGAHWSPTAGPDGKGAVVDASGNLDMDSPRIRPIVIIDINNYIQQGCSGTTCIGKVANILGFFAEGMCNDVIRNNQLDLANNTGCDDPTKDVVGRIVTLPGSFAQGTGTTDDSAAFIKVIKLVR